MKHWFSDVGPFRRDPLAFVLDRARGAPEPLEPLALGFSPYFLVTDPEVARTILKADEAFIEKGRLVRKLRPLLGDSFLSLNGEEHHLRRTVLHHQLARGVANQYIPTMSATIRQFAANLMRDPRFDAHAVAGPLALTLACVALFGAGVLSSGDRQVIIGAVKSIEADLADEMFRAWPQAPWTQRRRLQERRMARDDISFVVKRVRSDAYGSGVLRALEGLGLSDDQIRDEILTMLLAGHHTTGTAAAWIFYYLATEANLADAVCAEARELADEIGEFRSAALSDAAVSLSLVREVLRLYPSAWWFSREVVRPTVVAGRKLKPGTSLIICPWQMHRDPRFWNEPDKFLLQRAHNGPAYMPFGSGPRACVGMGVAILELQLLALEMAAAFEFKVVSPTPAPWPSPSVTLIPPRISICASLRDDRLGKRSAA